MNYDKLKTDIKEMRNIKDSSLDMYVRNIKKLNEWVGKGEFKGLDFLKDIDKIMDVLKDKALATRKNYLASIVVSLSPYEKYDDVTAEYAEMMDDLSNEDKDNKSKQQKTTNQAKNWTSIKDLQEVLNEYKKVLSAKGIMGKKEEINKADKDLLQKYVVGSLYIGDPNNHPPLRMDYSPMEIITKAEYNKLPTDKDMNYLVIENGRSKFFSFNEYKTAGKYGEKKIKLSKSINNIMNHWLKYNKSKWLLVDNKDEPLTPNKLTKFLIKTFKPTGKSISGNILRHIYITETFPPQNDKKQAVADLMMNSISEQTNYAKH